MQTQTIKIELLINGKKVNIGHQFLEYIAKKIPDSKENQSIFDILACSDNPEVREALSYHDNLNKKTIHLLLEDTNQEVVDSILSNSTLAKHINEDVLFKIMKTGNIKYLTTIASNVEDYVKCDLCKIVKKLANHKNPLVRYELVRWRANDIVTNKILKQLSNDKDIDVAKEAQEELDRRDR
ncbi:MAG: hypothetical protein U9N59_10905 [Campylobacterota bacterium]|nr:hypothetical protein [Campylobacterota bacterium]